MLQNKKLSTLLAVGLCAIFTSTGCATSVEEPVVIGDEEMSADMTAESSEALTAGGWGGARFRRGYGKFDKFPGRGYAWGRRGLGHYGRGYLGHYAGYGYGGYGYGDYGYDHDDFDDALDYDDRDIVINNIIGGGYGDYGDYGDILDYDDCDLGYGDYVDYDDCFDCYDDDWH